MMTTTPSFARITAGVAATLFTVALAVPALAQTQPPAPQPAKPAPAKPAAPAAQAKPGQAPAAAQQAPGQGAPGAPGAPAAEPKFAASPWQKICQEVPEKKKQLCVLTQILGVENQAVANVDIVEMQDDPKKTIRVTVPLGMRLQPGMRITLDKDTVSIPFVVCAPMPGGGGACIGEQEITSDFITKFRKANAIYLQMLHASGRTINQPMSNSDFGKAYDGPGKDAKVAMEEERKRQQDAAAADQARKAQDEAALLKRGQQLEQERAKTGQ